MTKLTAIEIPLGRHHSLVAPSSSPIQRQRSADMNLFENVPTHLPSELIEVLAEGESVRIERIVSTGHSTDPGEWYDQAQDEWVVVLKGEARLRFSDDKVICMKPGDHLLIPAHQRHRVEWTTPNEPTLWLAVFFEKVSGTFLAE
ncbi:cupin domain-containing protein [Rhodopirellula sp. P2]|uniref:cupin domain-containing protein n=1 Tax=Rhodopirellula sp. P2 TaxID=2127060 RepID=UPI002368ECA2|nr:cupin domain-containing protein [Rhodopirellula sp. P2]WDQ15361.1 cupin domain-containing protein [Rhodopirellula sp. P2]